MRNTFPGLRCRSLSPFCRRTTLGAAAGLFLVGAITSASHAAVLPSTATPNGYSLSDLASATAAYNSGVISNSPTTPAAPSIPFQVLVNDATVGQNTYLYLPVYYADNSPPVDPAFPASVANQQTDAAYVDNLVRTGFNVSAFLVKVDGVITTLDDSYIAGVDTAPLPDGTPGGDKYIVAAAVISPLAFGDHMVSFGGFINGQPVIFGSDNVTVTPEPTAAAFAGCCGLIALARRKRRN